MIPVMALLPVLAFLTSLAAWGSSTPTFWSNALPWPCRAVLTEITAGMRPAAETLAEWFETAAHRAHWRWAYPRNGLPPPASASESLTIAASWGSCLVLDLLMCFADSPRDSPNTCFQEVMRMQEALAAPPLGGVSLEQLVLVEETLRPLLELLAGLEHWLPMRTLVFEAAAAQRGVVARDEGCLQPVWTAWQRMLTSTASLAHANRNLSDLLLLLDEDHEDLKGTPRTSRGAPGGAHEVQTRCSVAFMAMEVLRWGRCARTAILCMGPALASLVQALFRAPTGKGWNLFSGLLLTLVAEFRSEDAALALQVAEPSEDPASREEQCPRSVVFAGPRERTIVDMLSAVAQVLEDSRLTYFLDYGSALGALRVRGVLPGDYDADIGVLHSDYARVAAVLRQKLPAWLEVCNLPQESRPWGAATVRQLVVRQRPAPEAAWRKAALGALPQQGALPQCHDKPNLDIYAYRLRRTTRSEGSSSSSGCPSHGSCPAPSCDAEAVLERADLVDRRGPHYGPVPLALLLPPSRGCLGGRAFTVPREPHRYLQLRYGCIGVLGLECEPDTSFRGRGTYYRAISAHMDAAAVMRRMRATSH